VSGRQSGHILSIPGGFPLNPGGVLNLKSFGIRSLVALIFGPLVLFLAYLGGPLWLLFILLIALFSLKELFDLSRHKGLYPVFWLGGLGTLILVDSMYLYGEHALYPIIVVLLIAFFAAELYRRRQGANFLNPFVGFGGTLYVSLLFGSFVLIREMGKFYGLDTSPAGTWIMMILLSTWICDTAAYVGGSYIGRHKLIERISPNKTIEGTLCGFGFALVAAYLSHITFVQGLRLVDSLIIGAIVGSVGQYGDLFESMLKRAVGVKDSSSLIPGHGGILDRFDSLTFSGPVIYLYLRSFFF
jgi:phosphatidate cytidylyltransferase